MNWQLFVYDFGEGDLLVKEKLDEQLKGIGLGTFFIFQVA
jgi:hypothetical protein